MPLQFFLFFLGTLLLWAGSSLLVRGASYTARYFGISSLVIGLTVVAYGTSTPELVVSTIASWNGQDDLSFGNVIGSNIFNSLFIVGVVSLIHPLKTHLQLLFFDMPLTIFLGALTLGIGLFYAFTPLIGALFLLMLIAYTLIIVKKAKNESPAIIHEFDESLEDLPSMSKSSLMLHGMFIVLGLALLIYGADLIVSSSTLIARALGVSELVIALTIVAGGTSLPELATSLMASCKKEYDIALGNVVGSTIYNILAIIGVSALLSSEKGLQISPIAISQDVPIMIAAFILLLIFAWSKKNITRLEGLILLGSYICYTGYLVLRPI